MYRAEKGYWDERQRYGPCGLVHWRLSNAAVAWHCDDLECLKQWGLQCCVGICNVWAIHVMFLLASNGASFYMNLFIRLEHSVMSYILPNLCTCDFIWESREADIHLVKKSNVLIVVLNMPLADGHCHKAITSYAWCRKNAKPFYQPPYWTYHTLAWKRLFKMWWA